MKLKPEDYSPIYRLKKRNGILIGPHKLTNKNTNLYEEAYSATKQSILKNAKRITQGPGIYGIFVKDRRCKNSLGKCLYIGQSTDVKKRMLEHKKRFVHAQKRYYAYKQHHKNIDIYDIQDNIEIKYYKMVRDGYRLQDIKFAKLYSVPYIKDFDNILTYLEQHCIDVFHPLYNHVAARPSNKRR